MRPCIRIPSIKSISMNMNKDQHVSKSEAPNKFVGFPITPINMVSLTLHYSILMLLLHISAKAYLDRFASPLSMHSAVQLLVVCHLKGVWGMMGMTIPIPTFDETRATYNSFMFVNMKSDQNSYIFLANPIQSYTICCFCWAALKDQSNPIDLIIKSNRFRGL